MNILILSQRFWPENFRINLVVEKLKKNNKIFVLTEKPNYPNNNIPKKFKSQFFYKEKNKNIEIIRIPTVRRGASNFTLIFNYFNFILMSTIGIFFFKKKKIDIIFVYATSPIFQAIAGIIFSKIYKIPLVLWVQDLWPDVLKDLKVIKSKFLLYLISKTVNQIYKYSDFILVQSNSYKKIISKIVKKKIRVFHNPEVSNFKYKKKNRGNLIITYTGNLGKAQSIDCFLKSISKLSDKKFIVKVYGDGSEKNNMIKYIKKKKLNQKIFYSKPLSFNKLKKKINNSDALILFLKKGKALSNTLPAKIQTYLSFGKPIIVSSDGEAKKFVKKYGLGYSCPAENIDRFVSIISKTLNLPERKRKIIFLKSKKIFEDKVEINSWIKNLEQLFAQILIAK
tara:strand:- start:1746 stop:2930 length:1185 start_codon:yes stop_codon:yes gene_type:complete